MATSRSRRTSTPERPPAGRQIRAVIPSGLTPAQLQRLRLPARRRRSIWWRLVRWRGLLADLLYWTVRELDGVAAMVRHTPNLVPVVRRLWPMSRAVLPSRYAPDSAPWQLGRGSSAPATFVGDAQQREELPVVVVLAGLGTPWAFMRSMLDALTERGFRTVALPQLGWNFRSVAELAAMVDRYLRTHSEYGPVLLVGHSKGGLVAKQVLLNDPEGGRALGAVAISSPFRGARTARYVTGSSWRITREIIGLRPGTPAQLALAARDSVDALMVSIIPLYDPIVGVPGTLEAGKNQTVRALGHNRLLGEARVHNLVARELRRLAAVEVLPSDGFTTHVEAP